MDSTNDTSPGNLNAQLARNLNASFEQMVLAFQSRLFSFALGMTASREDAEEVVQDAFVRAYNALSGYPRDRIETLALRPWLYSITLNLCRNRVRGKKMRMVTLDGDLSYDAAPVLADRDGPEKATTRAETRNEIATLLATLSPKYRSAVVLRYVEDLSYSEIAEALERPEGTVKSDVHRGLRMLRETLKQSTSEVRHDQVNV